MRSVSFKPYLWRTTTSRVRDYPVFNCQPTAYPGQDDCGVSPRDTNGWSHTVEWRPWQPFTVRDCRALPPVHLTPAHLPVPKFAGVKVRWLSYMAAPCRHPLLARWHRGAVVFGGAWRVPQATRALPGSVLAEVTRNPRLLSPGAVAVRWVWMGRAPCAPGPILRGLQWHLHLTLGLHVAWVRGCLGMPARRGYAVSGPVASAGAPCQSWSIHRSLGARERSPRCEGAAGAHTRACSTAVRDSAGALVVPARRWGAAPTGL